MIGILILSVLLSGQEIMSGDYDGKTVEIEGRAIGLTESGVALKVDEIPLTVVTTNRPCFLTACSVTQPRLRVTGVLEQVYGSTTAGGSEGVVGFRLRADRGGEMAFEPDLRFVFNPFTLGVLVAILVVYLLLVSRRQLKTRTLMIERKRMADDLHDTIEQHLVGAGMLMQLGKANEARDILVRAKKEMRDIVWGLKNDDMMRQKPVDMIRAYAREETQKGVCRVETHLQGLPERLNASQMRDLSLIIREAIGNAIKHGHAGKVAIVADPKAPSGWCLRIANDGTPFDPKTALGASDGHFGLEGMKARARRLGAELDISVEKGRTVVTLSTLS